MKNINISGLNYDKIVLETIQLQIQHLISKHELLNTSSEVWLDNILNSIVVSLKQYIPKHELKEINHSYPKDWFQAFKERYYPKFILKYYPVEYTTIKLVVKDLYPDIALPDNNPHVVLYKKVTNLNGETYET